MKLKIVSIHNQGNADQEYVLLKVVEDCDLNRYAIYDATYTSAGKISNKQRHFYRFSPKVVEQGDLVSLRTGKGQNTVVTNDSGTKVHRFYWGLGHAVWNDEGDAAVLIEISNWNTTAA